MPISPVNDSPVFLIIAGPNGSGKSTAYTDTEVEREGRTIWIINPDLLTIRIQGSEAIALAEANLVAVQRIEKWLYASVDVHKSIGVETVLSTGKYRQLVAHAKARGFAFWFIYVVLDTEERNIERVKLRVEGGHFYFDATIHRSLEQFPWFLEQADLSWIYDNSGGEPKLIGRKSNGEIELDQKALKAVVDAVKTIETDS